MDKAKRRKLEAKGWRIGSAQEFLGLQPEEVALIEVKLALSRNVRKLRLNRKVTQFELARRLHSSQSRVAKIEAGDSSISLDLLVRTLIVLGASRKDLARIISKQSAA